MIYLIAILAIAAPTSHVPRSLPPSSVGFIQVGCSGGVAGRMESMRIGTDGTIERMGWNRKASGKTDPDEVKALWRRLDAIKFDTLASLTRGRPIPDGINCGISRFGGGAPNHHVDFPQQGMRDPSTSAQREARSVLSAAMKIGNRVSLNPQPIPPKESIKRQ
ncbi:hypothetical protein ACVWZA_001696 [Sphingomonas sp. UYAg733]